MASRARRSIGAALRRVEDPRLLTGHGLYLDDLSRPGLLHAAFVRSPHAHARIVRVDTLAARGIDLVLDGPALARQARPFGTRLDAPGYRPIDRPHLAVGRVRFVGEPVALVVADGAYRARDAAELVAVQYEPLPAVADARSALAAAVQLHEAAPGNVVLERELGSKGSVEAAFAEADLSVEIEIRHPRVVGLPIETRAVLAEFDTVTGTLIVWSSTQAPIALREALGECLDIPLERVRVMVPDVGGGFGLKAQVFPEEIAVAAAAVRLGRPVKWIEDRLEHLAAATHARDTLVRVEAAATRRGEILAIRADVLCEVGAYGVHPYGPILEPMGTATMIPGPYMVSRYYCRARAVLTNAAPEGAYRGVGVVVAALAHEQLLDELARRLRLDPAEVRRRNLLRRNAFPYSSPTGHLYDSGSYDETLDRALKLVDYEHLRAEQARCRTAGRTLGIGIACYTEYTGMGSLTFRGRGMLSVPGHESAWLRLEPDGRLTASLSLPSLGQGLSTTLAQALADEFEVPLDRVSLIGTDTSLTPVGSGTFGSRGAVAGAGALRAASDRLKASLAPLAAELLEVDPADVDVTGGGARVRGAPERRVTLAHLAAFASQRRGSELEVVESYDPPLATFSNATHVAVVAVDVETGMVELDRSAVVEDCGPRINPMIVEGQVHGATAQGIGGALFEELVYDGNGQLLTASLMDYLVPTSAEVPGIQLEHVETPSPLTVGGYKGVGEGGTVGATAAVASAVADGLAPLGAHVNRLPLTPERVRALIRAARGQRMGDGGRGWG